MGHVVKRSLCFEPRVTYGNARNPLEGTVVFERLEDGKIRVRTSPWDDAKVILANQVLEVAIIGKQVGLVQVDSPALT
jgi:hypothetical protein